MPETLEALVLLIVSVMPGFVCWNFLSSQVPNPFVSDAHTVVMSLIFSVVIQMLLLPWTISLLPNFVRFREATASLARGGAIVIEVELIGWLFSSLLLVPALLSLLLSTLWKWSALQPVLRLLGISVLQKTPRAWDRFFLTSKRGCWIVAEMDDGSVVGGIYGKHSFASLSPYPEDLYLERAYWVDENHDFLDPIPGSSGVWIKGEKVKKIHFYRGEEGRADVGNE